MADHSDLPIFLVSAASSRAVRSGLYVFTGSSACTMTLPNLNPSMPRPPDNRVMYFKNRGTAQLTLSPSSGAIFDGISIATLILLPGEGCVLIPDNGVYAVIARSGLPKLPTASRPAWSSVYVGFTYFDTTLNKLVIAGAAAYETVTSA